MQIKVNNKHILVYLLICSLLLTSYINVLNPNGLISADVHTFGIFFANVRVEPSAMNGGANGGDNDYMARANASTEFSLTSIKQLRWLGTKNRLNLLTAIVAAQMTCLIYYAKLSDRICTQFNSIMITVYLHKKDGMK